MYIQILFVSHMYVHISYVRDLLMYMNHRLKKAKNYNIILLYTQK